MTWKNAIPRFSVFVIVALFVGESALMAQGSEPDSTQQRPVNGEMETMELPDLLEDDVLMDGETVPQDAVDIDTTMGADQRSFWQENVFGPMRFGINYELTYKFTKPDELIKNRLSYRLEYAKFLFNNLYLQLDTKLFTFLNGDSRGRDFTYYVNDDFKEADFAFGSITRNAYVQYSYKKASITAGIQTLAWGESDFAAVTDEINPFDFRDPLNLNIDELRLGQLMATLSLFSDIGDWSCFFVPDPRFNLFPEEGTRFYVDPFEGRDVRIVNDEDEGNLFEYGLRWKKTFGKSDISIIATSLIDNNRAQQQIDSTAVLLSKRRYTTLGMSFNYTVSNFLVRGEAAFKYPRVYNNTAQDLVERNAFDTSLGFEYAPNSTTSFSLELVNNHVADWQEDLIGVPKNDFTAFLGIAKQLMKNDLSLNYIGMYNAPNTTFFNLLSTAYKLNDNITVSLDTLVPLTNDEKSAFFQFREQQQFAFKIQLLF